MGPSHFSALDLVHGNMRRIAEQFQPPIKFLRWHAHKRSQISVNGIVTLHHALILFGKGEPVFITWRGWLIVFEFVERDEMWQFCIFRRVWSRKMINFMLIRCYQVNSTVNIPSQRCDGMSHVPTSAMTQSANKSPNIWIEDRLTLGNIKDFKQFIPIPSI